ncbi:MAG: hypothetical protein ACTSUK_05700, partial [Promethearchaeota archaeon]
AFIVDNSWILQQGSHIIRIEATDADNDVANDQLTSTYYSSFETSLQEIKDYVIWEISELKTTIEESNNEYWGHPGYLRKKAIDHHLSALQKIISIENFDDAYQKLLHDIKPKLTGLKTNENEEPWGNGCFLNPWVNNPQFQEILRLECNNLLNHIIILQSG